MLNLGGDCGVYFFNTLEARIGNKRGQAKKIASIRVWFIGRVYKMHRKFGNCWM
jgi:hypothetical protein